MGNDKVLIFLFALPLFLLINTDKASALSNSTQPIENNLDPNVQILAKYICINLQKSTSLAPYNTFALPDVYDIFNRVGSKLLAAAGFYDPRLAKVAADAGKAVGVVTSPKYFCTIGYMLANFLKYKGVLTPANAAALGVKIVKSIELAACKAGGVTSNESVMNATVLGFFEVLNDLGMTDYDSMVNLFCLFAGEIETVFP